MNKIGLSDKDTYIPSNVHTYICEIFILNLFYLPYRVHQNNIS